MRVNRQIRVPRVRVIDQAGQQIGILTIEEALRKAEDEGVDLVEIVPTSSPPVCKIIDYGKYRYDQTKREKESRKSQHQIKVKEIKVKPNIDEHDLETKLRHAREFFDKGNKVKFTCQFRGREMAHPEHGHKLMQRIVEALGEVAIVETPMSQMGRMLTMVLAPGARKKVEKKTPPPATPAS